MTASMTGFGRGSFLLGGRPFRLELRSVNSRFLDLKVRMPWANGELEHRAAELIRQGIRRGRVELLVLEDQGQRRGGALKLDERLAAEVGEALHKLTSIVGCDLPAAAQLVSPIKELIILEAMPGGTDEIWAALAPALESALEELSEMRLAEGKALSADISGHLLGLLERHGEIAKYADEEPRRQRDLLLGRIRRLQLEDLQLDPARITEAVALVAEKCDINEELARIRSHAEQIAKILEHDEEVGRKMDFLLQELHRELNTIASKTQRTEIAHLIVESKGIVEKMREQAQNVE